MSPARPLPAPPPQGAAPEPADHRSAPPEAALDDRTGDLDRIGRLPLAERASELSRIVEDLSALLRQAQI